MKTMTIRRILSDNLYEENKDGRLQIKELFEHNEISWLSHFKIPNTNSILQFKKDYERVDPFSEALYHVKTQSFTEDEYFLIIKNLVMKGLKFRFILDSDDDTADYFNGLGLLKQVVTTKQDYINLLEKHKAEFIENIYSLEILEDINDYIIAINKNGVIKLRPQNLETTISDSEFLNNMLSIMCIAESSDSLEPILTLEKIKEPNIYNKLYVVADYLKENKAYLPEDVVEALNSGAEKIINELAAKFKD